MRKTALPFSLALLACACSAAKHTATSAVQTETGREARRQTDSIAGEQIAAELERMAVAAGESITDIIVFDTDKPPADSTGLSPVKAILRKQTKQTRERATAQAETAVQVDTQAAVLDTETARTEQTRERKPTMSAAVMRFGIGLILAAAAVVAAWIFYKRIKS